MSEVNANSNIFGENFSSFVLMLKQFKDLDKMAVPVQKHEYCEKQIYTITPQKIGSEQIFPVFANTDSIEPPFLQKTPPDILKTIFCNPAIQTILINPPLEKPKAGSVTGRTIKLNRNKISIMTGCFQTEPHKENSDNFLKNIMAEMNRGNFHNANYISSLAIAQGKAQAISAIYPQILINLRLYQDAYDFIKVFPQNPLMLYYSAVIFRVTGNFKRALEILHSIAEEARMENKKNLQKAWIAMGSNKFEEAENKFKQLLDSPLEKNEASIGLGMTLSKKGFQAKDMQTLNEALETLKQSLDLPGGLNAQAHFYLGNIYFNTAKYPEALEHYEKSFKLTPSLPAMINTTNTYLKLSKHEEALTLVLSIALIDLGAAEKILLEFPKDILSQLNTVHPDISTIQNMSQYANIFNISKPEEKKEPPKPNLKSNTPETTSADGVNHEISQPIAPETPSKPKDSKMSQKTKNEQFLEQIKSARIAQSNSSESKEEPADMASLERNEPIAQSDRIMPEEEKPQERVENDSMPATSLKSSDSAQSDGPEEEKNQERDLTDSERMASLEPNQPIAQSDRIAPSEETSPQQTEDKFTMESSSNIFNSNIQNAHQADNKNDEFIARAFNLASQLENDLGTKVHFNIEGLKGIEKKLRLTFLGNIYDRQQKQELALDCAAFLCYMLKEKHKGKLIKFPDFDPWAWPMFFENSEIVTYPIER
ncbi:MAG: tetratricopeptide repeat protein, partial [Elusimicrobiota bacterium]|nr:tetratricopeptide repeat protein [Elusimicrobiota bacterium]